MRALIAPPHVDLPDGTLDDAAVDALYAHDGELLRLSFVSTLDGAATGSDGVSGSINTEADGRGYRAMGRAADVVLVGAGTARAEEYGSRSTPLVVVSRHGELPESVREGDGTVVLATVAASGVPEGEHVWHVGRDEVDLAALVQRCRAAFGPHVLCEGGPSLAGDLVAAGLVDELGLSWAPSLVVGSPEDHPRILRGPAAEVALEPVHLLEEDGTLVGLWRVRR